MQTSSSKDLLFGSLVAFHQTFVSWMDFIDDGENYPLLHRRNAISIWLRTLVEFLGKTDQRRNAMRELERSESDLSRVSETLVFLENASKSILSMFSEDEQIEHWFIRNTALHGHLSLFFHDNLGIAIYDSANDSVRKIYKTRLQIHEAMQATSNAQSNVTQRLKNNGDFQGLQSAYAGRLSDSALQAYHLDLFGSKITTLQPASQANF